MVEDRTMTDVPTIDKASRSDVDPEAGMPSRQLGVLIADDDSLVRTMLRIGLQIYGFRVFVANNGKSALELYRQHREAIDVVLLDVRMPELDGPLTLDALRVINPNVCCCFMSGETGKYPYESLEQWKPARFFSKPFALPAVARTLMDLAGAGNDRDEI
jgi:CheY-like chemotaxis protein